MYVFDLMVTLDFFMRKIKLLRTHYNVVIFKLKFFRMLYGGLWLKFEGQSWMRFEKSDHEGYIKHSDGGEFHKSLKEIKKIENYPWRIGK